MADHHLTTTSAEVDADSVRTQLQAVGLRPTKQRVALAQLLFGAGDRHLTAEDLLSDALASGVEVSLATVY
ncbi:MAG: transcriptional repressor, partial [Pseudomonadota bacterium]